MKDLTTENFSAITADNYEAAISLLNDFASAGSVGSMLEQRQVMPSQKGKATKQPKVQSVSPRSCSFWLDVDSRLQR